MPVVKGIYRYPIKGLSPQAMTRVDARGRRSLSFDRVFALARPGAPIDPAEPKWAKKSLFLMLMLDDGARRGENPSRRRDGALHRHAAAIGRCSPPISTTRRDWPAIEAFFHEHVPTLREPPRLVRSRDGHFMDKPDNLISLINLATVRSLEEQWGYEIDPLRFRANFYIDGAKPWEEFDWIGQDIRARRRAVPGRPPQRPLRRDQRQSRRPGGAISTFRARCAPRSATRISASTSTTRVGGRRRDRRRGGDAASRSRPRARRAAISRPASKRISGGSSAAAAISFTRRRRACRRQAIPPGTPFADIPASWSCPDCGTDKTNFRPYVPGGRPGASQGSA